MKKYAQYYILMIRKTVLLTIAVLLITIGIYADRHSRLPLEFKSCGYNLRVEGSSADFSFRTSEKKISNRLSVITITMKAPVPTTPSPVKIKWSQPSCGVAGVWKSNSYLNKTIKPDWYPSKVKSMLAKNAPVIQLFGNSNNNILTFAVSDALNTVELSTGVREEDGRIYCVINLFKEKHKAIKEYSVEILIDRTERPFYKSLNNVASWWASHKGFEPAEVPEIATKPMYSTWYSYHQNMSEQELISEVRVSARMGFKAIIVDDGWQTLDSNRGYAYTGDWKPERLTKMKQLVNTVHKEGLKFILWYGVPLVGEKSETFPRFKGKYLRQWKGQGAWELDPRYPEVRHHIIDTYRRAIADWGVDGFKLDFLGRFVANSNTELTRSNGRDYASVNEATDRLMTDIIRELRKVNKDIMIEFRQPYTGPLMRKYGNMFRVGDCPNSYVVNRVGMVDLRLISGNTAVHSDMIMWTYKERVEDAALQFLNIIFSVPQISVRLEDIPKDHFKMVKFITEYCNRNRETLLNGELKPQNPAENYPVISAHSKKKSVYALYSNQIISPESGNFDLINATTSKEIHLNCKDNFGKYNYKVFNCMGELKDSGTINLTKRVHTVAVPPSGVVEFHNSKTKK